MTRLSSKGQIILPREIRRRLHLIAGDRFVVWCDDDSVFLKKIERPVMDRLRTLLKESRAYAKKAGLTQADLDEVIRKVRAESKRGFSKSQISLIEKGRAEYRQGKGVNWRSVKRG